MQERKAKSYKPKSPKFRRLVLLPLEYLAHEHAHFIVFDKLARGLVPFFRAMTQAMFAVAVGAELLAPAEIGIWMAALAE